MSDVNNARRRFLQRLLAVFGGSLVSGCDQLSQKKEVQWLLGRAEGINAPLHKWLGRSGRLAQEFDESDISPSFPANGSVLPASSLYKRLMANDFSEWRLLVDGQVRKPQSYCLEDLYQLPRQTQITRHDCVEGWSAIAHWAGVRLSVLLDRVEPLPQARYVVFHCADSLDGELPYYESIDFEDAYHPQTLLAYEMNHERLPVRHGAPLRLRVERQLGYKSAKFIMRIELADSFAAIAGGKGGYWEDHGYEWFAGI